jgi:hypothetical protein
MHLVIEYYNYSRWYRLHSYPCDTLALMWQDPCRVDRAVRAKLTAEPETDCARDCTTFASFIGHSLSTTFYISIVPIPAQLG